MKKVCLLVLVAFVATTNSQLFAQKTRYSKEVLAKIEQVEQHLAGQIRTPDDRDWSIQERMKHHNVHGLSMAVVHNYQIEWAKGYGWADTAQSAHRTARPVTTETRFQAGSISKSLNGVGILTLVQKKKIDLYANINNYLTTWKFPYDSVAKNKKINTANLLSHTAGLTIHGFPGYVVGRDLPSLPQILNGEKPANTQAVRSQFEPGLKYKYSGGGTTISQLMLMDITHQPYDQYMWEHVLKPMGMINSSYTQPPANDAVLATGYYPNGKAVTGNYNLYPEQAAAGLWTTPSDLCRYVIETQRAYQGKSSKVLTPEMTRLRLTPYVDSSAALGVFIEKKGKELYFSHSGADNGFLSVYYGSLTDGNGVVVMINSLNGAVINEVVNSVATVYGWKDFYKPIIKQVITVSETILDRYMGQYELAPNFILTITKGQSGLMVQPTGQSKQPIFAEAETKFFPKAFEADIEFVRDDSGKVTKLILLQGGRKTEGEEGQIGFMCASAGRKRAFLGSHENI